MLSEIPAPSFVDLEHVASVSFWGKKRLDVYWNNHAGMALFKELKNTRREIVHVTDDETQAYVRARAHLIVDNHFNTYTLEHPNEPKWHECDDCTSVVASLTHFVASAVAEPHHLILDIEHIHSSTGERRPASESYAINMYNLSWRDITHLWPHRLNLNVRNFTWLENVHHQRATHIIYSRCADGDEPDKDAIRKMALQFHIDAVNTELEAMRQEMERKEAIVQHMRNELAATE